MPQEASRRNEALPSSRVSPYSAAMAQQSPQDERKQRLAAALRENLKRRKAQAKAHAKADSSQWPDGPDSQDGVGGVLAEELDRKPGG
jgi:hypothetical protein